MTSTSTRKAPPRPAPAKGTVTLHKSGATSSFEPEIFDQQVRDIGYLMYWSSGELCPCRSNTQTDQADPSCPACDGSGFVYMLPDAPRLSDYDDPRTCTDFPDRADAKATQAILTAQTQDVQIFEHFGEWIFGVANLTTFSWNEVGYRDRFEHQQSLMTYRQVLKVPDSLIFVKGRNVKEKLRYRVIKLLRVAKIVGGSIVDITDKVVLNDDGTVDLTAAPVIPGDFVTIGYRFHPIWIVTDYAMAVRDSRQHAKTVERFLGKHEILPVHSFVKLDFLL